MTSDNSIDNLNKGITAVSELVKAAGNTPTAKEAAENIGKSAVTVTKAVNNVLLPIAAINFAVEKARVYFSERFEKELTEIAGDIPSEKLVEPNAAIVGPILNALAYSHEEEPIKEMFLQLIKSSMDARLCQYNHPAYAHIVRQLDPLEARYIGQVIEKKVSTAIVEIYRNRKIGSRSLLARHLMPLTDVDGVMRVPALKQEAMVDNWLRLGLVEVHYGDSLTGYSYIPG